MVWSASVVLTVEAAAVSARALAVLVQSASVVLSARSDPTLQTLN